MKYLVTGAAGFIGYHVIKRLCQQGHQVIGIDNINNYYDIKLKHARLSALAPLATFQFIQLDISDRQGIADLFVNQQFDQVIHLAAQAGVRYSIENPMAYADSNVIGHLNILEGCRHHKVQHLVYASSSSVYGLNSKVPFATSDSVDHPISLYAATKKSNEVMSHTYSHLYDIPTTGLRFFTVYGPWGRPDMALFKFTKAMLEGQSIDIYNQGDMRRDFTYIDDIVEGIIRIKDIIPAKKIHDQSKTYSAAESSAPYKIYNIGHGKPIKLMAFVHSLETALGLTAKKNFMPMQAGDVYQTYADVEDLFTVTGYRPITSVEQGVSHFVNWYREFYQC